MPDRWQDLQFVPSELRKELAPVPSRSYVQEGYRRSERMETDVRSSISEDDSLSDASSYGSTDSGLSHPPRKWEKKKKKKVVRFEQNRVEVVDKTDEATPRPALGVLTNTQRTLLEERRGTYALDGSRHARTAMIPGERPPSVSERYLAREGRRDQSTLERSRHDPRIVHQMRQTSPLDDDDRTPRSTFMETSNIQSGRADRYGSSADGRDRYSLRIASQRGQVSPPDDDQTPRPTFMMRPGGSEAKQQRPKEKSRDPRVSFETGPTGIRPRSATGIAPRTRNFVVPCYEEKFATWNETLETLHQRVLEMQSDEHNKATGRIAESQREQGHIHEPSPRRSRIPVRRKADCESSASEEGG